MMMMRAMMLTSVTVGELAAKGRRIPPAARHPRDRDDMSQPVQAKPARLTADVTPSAEPQAKATTHTRKDAKDRALA